MCPDPRSGCSPSWGGCRAVGDFRMAESLLARCGHGVGISIILPSASTSQRVHGPILPRSRGVYGGRRYTSAMLTTVLGSKLEPVSGPPPVGIISGEPCGGRVPCRIGPDSPSGRPRSDSGGLPGHCHPGLWGNHQGDPSESESGGRSAASAGFLPTPTFWTFTVAAVTVYVVWGLLDSTYGRGFLAVAG